MNNFSIFIPAQEKNLYSPDGDLTLFGQNTLLDWKIAQCKKIAKSQDIYISSSSKIIASFAQKEGVNFLDRSNRADESFFSQIIELSKNTKKEYILWTNVTSPFLDERIYTKMLDIINKDKSIDIMQSSINKFDYAYFKNKKLNFDNTLTKRTELEPLVLLTNGVFIFKSQYLKEVDELSIFKTKKYKNYNLDHLASLEVKDIMSYEIAQDLISIYFKNKLYE